MIEKFRAFLCAGAAAAMLVGCVSSEPARPVPTHQPKPVDRPAPVPANPTSPSKPAPKPAPYVKGAPAGMAEVIRDYWRAFPGKTGVAIQAIDDDWKMGERLDDYFPQQSVSKTWVALTVLEQVDQGRLSLDQKVHIGMDDLTLFHQPIRARVIANGGIDVSIRELLEASILTSDCTANDSLLRTAGGPTAVRAFVERHNLGQIRFGPGERLLQSGIAGMDWQQRYSLGNNFEAARAKLPLSQRQAALNRYLADPVDGASPGAIVGALAQLAKGELLSPSSTKLMLNMMSRVTSGPNRLKAGVPAGWGFGHKTGTGQILGAVSTGYNDIGIMTAPDGKRYAVAVMMADTTASIPARMVFMQSISRTVADYHQR